ncbi:HsdM family class I SAM-dependent methyltransferase [Halomonas binhaiensis]|uniref:site-specific DNA-methyltransferase (adenine-specific) n=1 Tax=Halomonas binhaiensis TaxID=2562282 RepID=A0A856QS10_9GAMM|nr:N-6 DNA methylase [Halomonas binhaiensis]QEM82690.2 N-6 DNA methylase [Halomonas binhaiensis]
MLLSKQHRQQRNYELLSSGREKSSVKLAPFGASLVSQSSDSYYSWASCNGYLPQTPIDQYKTLYKNLSKKPMSTTFRSNTTANNQTLRKQKQCFRKYLSQLRTLPDTPLPRDILLSILDRYLDSPEAFKGIDYTFVKNTAIDNTLKWLKSLNIEYAAYWAGSLYSNLIPSELRKQQANYFTPPPLTNRLLDKINNNEKNFLLGRIIDPACGGAAFLIPALLRLKCNNNFQRMSPYERLLHVETHFFGADIDSALVETTKIFLYAIMADDISASGYRPQWNILTQNGLEAFSDTLGSFNLVLSNPPYRKMKRAEVEQLSTPRLRNIVEGQSNLYALFTLHALDLLQDGGEACLITPMSFFSGRTFCKLRQALDNEAYIKSLDLIHEKGSSFFGAEQDAALTHLCKGRQPNNHQTRINLIDTEERVTDLGLWTISQGSSPWTFPRTTEGVNVLNRCQKLNARIVDYGYKIVTGHLVDYRDKRPRYTSLDKAPNPQKVLPLIWAHAVQPGVLDIERARAAGCPCFVDQSTIPSGAGEIRTPAVALQRVTAPKQVRRLVAAAIPTNLYETFGGVVGENHVLFLVAIENPPLVPAEGLAALIGSSWTNEQFRCISGATNVSSYELSQLRLPPPEHLVAAYEKTKDWIEAVTQITQGEITHA